MMIPTPNVDNSIKELEVKYEKTRYFVSISIYHELIKEKDRI